MPSATSLQFVASGSSFAAINDPNSTPAADSGVSNRSEPTPASVDLAIPVYNEATGLRLSIERLLTYLDVQFPFSYRITIVDNASTDATLEVARALEAEHANVVALHLDQQGRGRALRHAWSHSASPVVAYMDVDLSTDLSAFLPLVAPLLSGHSDVAIGSRLTAGSSVARAPKREIISRSYNLILRTVFATQIRDAQCGFKAVRTDIATRLLPAVEDNAWFFDTELLLLAERNGLRIHQVPVDWIDDPDSRVHVAQTARDDLRGAYRVARSFAAGRGRVDLDDLERAPLADDFGRRIVSFATIGALSTVVSLVLFLATRHRLGVIGANAFAISATFVFNTFAHARYTFGSHRNTWKPAVLSYIAALIATSAALGIVVATNGGTVEQIATLIATWGVATGVRLALIHRPHGPTRRH